MALTKQAKILTKKQQEIVLSYLQETRDPIRNKLIFLLSCRGGLRAKEIANITWSMVTDAQGNINDHITLHDVASKGKSGGIIWLNNELKKALIDYQRTLKETIANETIIKTRNNNATSPQVIVNMFHLWYKRLGYDGCSSHSGRRTFITNMAKNISKVGGSIRDVQSLARHSSLSMTQKYIECDINAQKRVVQLS